VTPASWLVAHIEAIAPAARVLDVASGRGRNALYVAASGRPVHAVDRDADALAALTRRALADDLPISTEVLDLENGQAPLGTTLYGGVIVFNYLHRPLMPKIIEALAPGGVLIYETFTVGQAARGHPRNPAFLLRPGELRGLVAPLRVLHWREGEFDDKLVASIVARK
jgi:SAM-dependent methyltransferase